MGSTHPKFSLSEILTRDTKGGRYVKNSAEVKIEGKQGVFSICGKLTRTGLHAETGTFGGSWLYAIDQMGVEHTFSKVEHGKLTVTVLSRGTGPIPNRNPLWNDRKSAQKIGKPQVEQTRELSNRTNSTLEDFKKEMRTQVAMLMAASTEQSKQFTVFMAAITPLLKKTGVKLPELASLNTPNSSAYTLDGLRNFAKTNEGYKMILEALVENTKIKAA